MIRHNSRNSPAVMLSMLEALGRILSAAHRDEDRVALLLAQLKLMRPEQPQSRILAGGQVEV